MVSFLENNQETFNILLSFLVMSKGFKFAFSEINFPPDIDELITTLQSHEKCQDLQLVILKLDDPDLHFLLENLKQHLLTLKLEPEKKLVLILRGLEKAIGTSGNNPPILTNLNYARDSFPKFIPHPILFILPDYAATRFAKFAPDFWAWTSANFRFQMVPEVRHNLLENAFHPITSNRTYAKVTKSENIELLTRLLQEYTEETEASQRTRIELLQQLGKEHQSVREFTVAKEYLQEALTLCRELQYQSGEAKVLYDLGEIFYLNREFKEARLFLQQSLVIYQTIDRKENQPRIYHLLGIVAQKLREYEEARNNYQQAIAICVEFGDRYEQAGTYHQLGNVDYLLREYEEARNNYQQALAIFVEFSDRYFQAGTYHQLGSVAEDLEEFQEAKTNFLQALSIYVEFNDQYMIETFSIPALNRLYQATQDPSILENLAQLFGTTVDQIATLFEDN